MLFVIAVFLGNAVWNTYEEYTRAKEKEQRASEELQTLAERKSELEKNLARLGTEKGIEAELRQRYNVGKEGEEVVVVLPNSNKSEQLETEEEGFMASLWQAIVDVFSF